jgi:hypothetical protein
MRRLLLAVGALALLVPAPALAATMRTFKVPTGGFAIDLPTQWVDVTSSQKTLQLKLIAIDPTQDGKVYMNVGATKVGKFTTKQVATFAKTQLKKTLGAKGAVESSVVTLPVGTAYRLHVSKKGAPNESDEYVFVKDQVEYVIVYVAPAAQWKARAAAFAASAKTFRFVEPPNLSKLVLSARQVGPGYKLTSFPRGSMFIGEATLDLCAGTFASEALRTARLQVRYSHTGSGVDVSNEVVRYAGGGAKEALREVGAVARSCAAKPKVVQRGTVTETYRISALKDPKLPKGAIVVKLQITLQQGKQRQTQTGVAVYQVKGNTLSGVYAFVGKGTTYVDAQRVAFHAAEQSARNLGSTGSSGGTGFTA